MNSVKLDEIRQSDPETMTNLLEEVAPVILSIARHYKVDPEVTLQEVAIHLLRDPGRTARLAEEGALLRWCRVLSRNTAIHQLQREQKDRLPDVSIVEPLLDPADPERLLEGYELISQLLSSLDEVDQKIVIRRYVDELAFDEIASQLSLKAEHVRRRASRAIAKLRYGLNRRIER